MSNIMGLNIRSMQYLMCFVDNNYNMGATAIDFDVDPASVSSQIKRIEEGMDYEVFVRGKKKFSDSRTYIIGFTASGWSFYLLVEQFMTGLDLIGE